MPTTCLVVGCGSRSNRDTVSFYNVPAILKHRYLTHLNDLSKKRRERWLAAIKRDDLTESKIKYQKVCSKHFLTGKPAELEDENNPDWVPSQHMGHASLAVDKRKDDVARQGRAKKRQKVKSIVLKHEVQGGDEDVVMPYEQGEQASGTSTQTDLTMAELDLKFSQLGFAAQKIELLENKLETTPFGLMQDPTNVDKWKYYTGFEYEIVHVILSQIDTYLTTTATTALSSSNQLLLTLVKLRLDLHFKDLAYRFKISPTTASTYFQNVLDIMYQRFEPMIQWPDRSVYRKNIPLCFKEAFQEKTSIIIDCFEIFIEKPASMKTQQQCWSNYKHHHTLKFLIGITPQGTISFISKAWGGRTSDKQIVELSGFCQKIKPGDVVLADRGFLIEESLGILQAKLVIPAFTRGKNQLHPLEIEETRNIAQVRIHVERIIGTIKNKFGILTGSIPISMVKKHNDSKNCNILDKIVVVCCALINITPPIIPL